MNIIMKSLFGSKLYGLDTHESDTDYLGIYLPTLDELLLGNYKNIINLDTNKKGKNSSGDIDTQYYALPYFVELSCRGETTMLDMLHSTVAEYQVSKYGSIWVSLQNNRHKFYTKGLKSYAGYLKSQIHKYSGKGKKLQILNSLITMLNKHNADKRLSEVWNYLPTGEYFIKDIADDGSRMKTERYWMVMGSKYMESIKISYCKEQIQKKIDSYGKRAQKAEADGGVDWKAVSHGLRAGYQLIDIYTKGYFNYPLDESVFIMKAKNGELDYETVVEPELKRILNKIDYLVEESDYPDKVDRKFWNNWLLDIYKDDLIDGLK